jgi:hypothetical protein
LVVRQAKTHRLRPEAVARQALDDSSDHYSEQVLDAGGDDITVIFKKKRGRLRHASCS